MKQVILTTTIAIAFSFLAINANAKNIVKDTENFIISTDDSIELTGSFEKTWTIEYGENNHSIAVYERKTKNGEEYIVRNDYFEVRYTNTKKGFGVKRIKKNDSKINFAINDAVINENEMHNQSILSPTKLNQEKALGYIAGFVPLLLNENYKHLLN